MLQGDSLLATLSMWCSKPRWLLASGARSLPASCRSKCRGGACAGLCRRCQPDSGDVDGDEIGFALAAVFIAQHLWRARNAQVAAARLACAWAWRVWCGPSAHAQLTPAWQRTPSRRFAGKKITASRLRGCSARRGSTSGAGMEIPDGAELRGAAGTASVSYRLCNHCAWGEPPKQGTTNCVSTSVVTR